MENKRPAIFLDRDGTIIEEVNYIREVEKVKLLPNSLAALKQIQEKGYFIFVISNQSGVGRGLITQDEFQAVHDKVSGLLQAAGIQIHGYLYCFHTPSEKCDCRKPGIKLIPKKVGEIEVDWEKSFTAGDKDCDVFLSDKIGRKAFLVRTGHGCDTEKLLKEMRPVTAYEVCEDLLDVATRLPGAPH